MKQTRAMEFATGLFVLLGFAALFFLITQTTSIEGDLGGSRYTVTARFDNVGTLKLRARVTVSGVVIGRVVDIQYDPDEQNALITMTIGEDYDSLPDDSEASILTAGLIGGQYISLTPGISDEYLEDGSEIEFTHSALVLENLVGRFLVKSSKE